MTLIHPTQRVSTVSSPLRTSSSDALDPVNPGDPPRTPLQRPSEPQQTRERSVLWYHQDPAPPAPRTGPSDRTPRTGPSDRPLGPAPRTGPSDRPLGPAPRTLGPDPRTGPSDRTLGPSDRPLKPTLDDPRGPDPRNGPDPQTGPQTLDLTPSDRHPQTRPGGGPTTSDRLRSRSGPSAPAPHSPVVPTLQTRNPSQPTRATHYSHRTLVTVPRSDRPSADPSVGPDPRTGPSRNADPQTRPRTGPSDRTLGPDPLGHGPTEPATSHSPALPHGPSDRPLGPDPRTGPSVGPDPQTGPSDPRTGPSDRPSDRPLGPDPASDPGSGVSAPPGSMEQTPLEGLMSISGVHGTACQDAGRQKPPRTGRLRQPRSWGLVVTRLVVTRLGLVVTR
ncbi:unnamed protein product [Arctogadus glacialis]